MSTGKKLPLEVAQQLADRIVRDLTPVTARIAVAGSVRRRKPVVGDIEVVVEPLQVTDMFGEPRGGPDIAAIRHAVRRKISKRFSGRMRYLKVQDVYGMLGVQLDIWMTHPPREWGTILAIRTGPKEFGIWCMTRLRRRGLRCIAGHVERHHDGVLVPTPEEEDFFRAAGMEYVEPWNREA